MFCPNCGKQLDPDEKFCAGCGASVTAETNHIQGTAAPAQNAGYSQPAVPTIQRSTGSALSMSLIAKILVLIAMVCFFFPFMSVSCSGVTTTELSGFEMVIGSSEAQKDLEDYGEESSRGDTLNIFVIGAAVFGVIALIARKKKITMPCSALSAAALVVFRITATSYYKIGDMTLKEYIKQDMITVNFGFALYLAIILFILAAVVFSRDDGV